MTDINEQEKEKELNRLKNACSVLSSHYDTVQIFATRHDPYGEPQGTRTVCWGIGNWYARYGQVREWVTQKENEVDDND